MAERSLSIFKHVLGNMKNVKKDVRLNRTINLENGIDFHICVLMENHSIMSSQFLYNLVHFHEIKVWPRALKFNFDPLFDESLMKLEKEFYLRDIHDNIKCSKIIVAFVTNKFCKSDEMIELIQHANDLKKPLIALVVEEIENYDQIKSTILSEFEYFCEIYKARFDQIGYDYFLWISNYFVDFKLKLGRLLGKPVGKKILKKNSHELNDESSKRIFSFYTINDKYSESVVDRVMDNFPPLKDTSFRDFYETFKSINLPIYRSFKDKNLKALNIDCKLLGKDYVYDPFYGYYDAILEIKNIGYKNDYLCIFQHIDHLINLKLDQYISSENVKINGKVPNELKQYYGRVQYRIHNLLKINERFIHKTKNLSKSDKDILETQLKNKIIRFIKVEFKKINVSMKSINQLYSFIPTFSTYTKINEIYETNTVIIYLFKHFYETGKFQHFYKNIVSIKKNVYILKLEDFWIDETIFHDSAEYFCGIYDIYRHAKEGFEGYELSRLFNDLNANLNLKLEIHKRPISNHYELFFLYLKEIEQNSLVMCIKNQLEVNDLKFCSKIELEDRKKEAIYDKMIKSKISLFVLTNEYLKSGYFQEDYELAKKAKTMILVVVVEPIYFDFSKIKDFNINQLNVIHANFENEESISRLWYFINKKLNRVKKEEITNQNEKQVISNLVPKNVIKIDVNRNEKKVGREEKKIKILDMQVHDDFMISYNSFMYVFDRKTSNFKFSMFCGFDLDFNVDIREICYAKCVDRMFFCISGYEKLLLVMKKNLGDLELFKSKKFESIISICYDEKSEALYIHCETDNDLQKTFRLTKDDLIEGLEDCKVLRNHADLRDNDYDYDDADIVNGYERVINDNREDIYQEYYTNCNEDFRTKIEENVISMKIINDLIYYLTKNSIYVFDLNLNYVTEFGYSFIENAKTLLVSSLSNYLFVVDHQDFGSRVFIETFNLDTFEHISSVDVTNYLGANSKNNTLIGDYLINISKDNQSVSILKAVFNVRNNNKSIYCDNNKFLCKINPLRTHLLKNPYELPCGNISCIECIYSKFNIYTNKFTCGYNECKGEHFLNSDTFKKSTILESNLPKICQSQIDYFDQKDLNFEIDRAELFEKVENLFDLLENDLEIRFESLKTDLDELYESRLKRVEIFENLLKMPNDDEQFTRIKWLKPKRFLFASFDPIKLINIGSTDLIPMEIKLSNLSNLVKY